MYFEVQIKTHQKQSKDERAHLKNGERNAGGEADQAFVAWFGAALEKKRNHRQAIFANLFVEFGVCGCCHSLYFW